MNTAIIVAAGRGTRFESDTPKQFLTLLGKPVIIHTLERFCRCPSIDGIVVVLADDKIDCFRKMAGEHQFSKPIQTIAGGKTRAESVRNGFHAVEPGSELVAVHDAARPLVTVDEIGETVEKARETGAACLVAPVTDTIKEIVGNRIARTIDRTTLRRALTPQVFRYEILREALANFDVNEFATDECYMVERMGREIACVEGSPRNIKITVPDDLILAEALLRAEGTE